MPVIYLHGTPDSRLARHPDDSLAARAGVRLVAVDRPGYGRSPAPSPGETPAAVTSWFATDLAALLDHLGIGQTVLLAWSGGALPALATTAAAPLAGRVTGVVVVSGVVPRDAYDDPAVREAAASRQQLLEMAGDLSPQEMAGMVAPMLAPHPVDPALAAEHQREHRSAADQDALATIPGAVEQMARALVEAVRNGLAGVETDIISQNYRSGTPPLREIQVPVRLWYGSEDSTTPPAFGTWYAAHLPRAELQVVSGTGHALLLTHWEELLATIAATRWTR